MRSKLGFGRDDGSRSRDAQPEIASWFPAPIFPPFLPPLRTTLRLTMVTPTLNLPPERPSSPLPDLPKELLLSLHQSLNRDALDAFVLSGEERGGGAQVEDVLNELIPNGALFPSRRERSTDDVC